MTDPIQVLELGLDFQADELLRNCEETRAIQTIDRQLVELRAIEAANMLAAASTKASILVGKTVYDE